ncbi:hypothetical protein FNF28_06837 [Cafeteria roenbergensis]|uniref:rhomboid protease n=1 Tax=Cafeteria roenbergensis TaxID=33653 RepID=A0A5A8CM70_CAFRO|nr:hypothetical protein FNF28_06837 [Cafeteria roenbergensis]
MWPDSGSASEAYAGSDGRSSAISSRFAAASRVHGFSDLTTELDLAAEMASAVAAGAAAASRDRSGGHGAGAGAGAGAAEGQDSSSPARRTEATAAETVPSRSGARAPVPRRTVSAQWDAADEDASFTAGQSAAGALAGSPRSVCADRLHRTCDCIDCIDCDDVDIDADGVTDEIDAAGDGCAEEGLEELQEEEEEEDEEDEEEDEEDEEDEEEDENYDFEEVHEEENNDDDGVEGEAEVQDAPAEPHDPAEAQRLIERPDAAVEAARGEEGKRDPNAHLLQTRPYLGYLIMAGCVFGMVYSFYLNNWEVEPLSVNFMVGPGLQALIEAGAKDTSLIVQGGEWWRLFTPMWLHAGIIHLVANMSVLLRFGWPMEKEAGWHRLGPVYFLGGILGSLASAVFLPSLLSVGASGACFAIIGAEWADLLQNWGLLWRHGHRWSCTLQFCCLSFSTALNLALGLMPFVDNFAHVFGLLGGLFVGSIAMIRPRSHARGSSCMQLTCAWLGGFCYVIMALVLSLALVFGVKAHDWCPFCASISCVEIADLWSCSSDVVPP